MSRRAKKRIPNVSIYRPTSRSEDHHKHLIAYFDGGTRHVESVSTDEGITQQYAMEVSRRLDRKRLGLITEQDERFLESAAKPLLPPRGDDGRPVLDADGKPGASHVGDYCDLLRARRREPKTVQMVESRVTVLLDLMEAESIADLSQDAVELAVAALAEEHDLADQTCVHYLKALKQFTRWLRKSKRARTDEAEDVEPFNVAAGIRHPRRPLADDEIGRLLAAAVAGAAHAQGSHRITGAERELVYLLALETGLRANELRWLTPESFIERDGRHLVVVEARTSKHRRRDEQPVRESVWRRMREHVAGRKPGKRIWDLPPKVFLMIREDLAAAGIPYYLEGQGYADFHALRHTYCTRLGRSGATIKECQQLMRHGDIRLTARYMHASLHDLARAVEHLPELRPAAGGGSIEPATLAATGTEDGSPHEPGRTRKGAQRVVKQSNVRERPGASASVPPGAEAPPDFSGRNKAQGPRETGIYGKIHPVNRLRSTEPKVAGSSPARCSHLNPSPAAANDGPAATPLENPQGRSAPPSAPAGPTPAAAAAALSAEQIDALIAQLSALRPAAPAPAAPAHSLAQPTQGIQEDLA